MKKKLWVTAILAATLICLTAANVSAATPDTCLCCGKSYSAIDWQPWTLTEGGSSNTLTADAHYYLDDDFTKISAQVRIGDGTVKPKITLDLRGHTIASSQRVFGVYNGATLSILDTVGGGTVEGRQIGTAQVGGVIRANEAATLNLYGGTVKDVATTSHAANGAAIATEGKNVVINIAGGNVQGGQFAPEGGAIFAARGAKVTVSAGTVTGGAASNGGAIFVNNATLTVTGGEVIGGEAINGGAIYATGNASVTVDGGTITGSAVESGGAIAMMGANLTVKSGNINGSKVKTYGSAIHLLKDPENSVPCSVNITGGTVSAAQDSGAAAISAAANAHTITVSGGKIIGAGKPSAGGAALSGQGTSATITVSGGEITGAASTATERSGLIYSRGIVDLTGGTYTVTGDGPAVYMYQRYCSLKLNSAAGSALSGKIFLEENAKVNCGYGVLKFAGSTDKGLWYYTCADTIAAYTEGFFLRPMGKATMNLAGKTVVLDINGKALTLKNGSFYGFDTANDTYNAAKCGTATPEDTATCLNRNYRAPNGSFYLTDSAEGVLTFHKLTFGIEDVSLRTEMGREGLYFSSPFAGDEVVKSRIATFGIAMSKQNLGSDEKWLAAMENGTAAYTSFGQHRFQTGVAPEKQTRTTGTLLKNIVNLQNSTETNAENAQTTVYSKAYVRLADGTYLTDTQQQARLDHVLQWTDSNFEKLSPHQQAGLLLMYDRFMPLMDRISTPYIRSVFDDRILDARREIVWQEIVDMNEILWTVDKETHYSFRATSKGLDTDLQAEQAKGDKYNPLSDDIGIFYPDRVYKGLPYTHASGNNAAIEHLGVRDEYGVYHIDANPSLFNGGSTNGSNATTGAYNVARIGNDCWDMVHWAWSKVATSVTADQTNQMTPDFGVQIVGLELLEKALKDNGVLAGDKNILDYICTPSNASATKDKLVYRREATELVLDNIRTKNADGTYDYQAMYQTYAMLQRGDGMVRYRNGAGHAIMVGGVTVVYNADGTINGDQSTLLILEQGSANEEYQARPESEFSDTAKHSSHTSVNKSCMYCCGYTDQVIDGKHVWMMDHPPQETSFKRLAETYYMGVTCAELNDNTPGQAPVISYSNISNAAAYIYAGNVVSNYRISAVTLDIFDDQGNLVNTSTLFGIQNGVRGPLYLNRFLTEQTAGAYGSVLAGTPALRKSGARIVTDLPTGNYTYKYTCELGTEQKFLFAEGSFTVDANGNAT